MSLQAKKIKILTPMEAELLKGETCKYCGDDFRTAQAVLERTRLKRKFLVHLNCGELWYE